MHTSINFMPVQFRESTAQKSTSINNTNKFNVSKNSLQRSHTAPSSTEMFRPPSVSDIPELSKENLRSMLE